MGWFPNKQQRDEIDERLLPSALRDQQLASRRVPVWLRIAVVVPSLVYAVYSIATVTGPYRWAAMFEANLRGGNTYTVQLAGLFAFLVCSMPALLATFALRRMFPMTAEELERERRRLPRARARERR